MSREKQVRIRLSEAEKAEIRERAGAAGFEKVAEYMRAAALGRAKRGRPAQALTHRGQARGSGSSTANEGAKAEPADPMGVEALSRASREKRAEVAERAGLPDLGPNDPRRAADEQEDWVKARSKRLHGQGYTNRVARRMAEAEWRAR